MERSGRYPRQVTRVLRPGKPTPNRRHHQGLPLHMRGDYTERLNQVCIKCIVPEHGVNALVVLFAKAYARQW